VIQPGNGLGLFYNNSARATHTGQVAHNGKFVFEIYNRRITAKCVLV